MTARAGGCFRSPPIRPHRTLPGGSKLEHVSPDLAQSRPGTACRHGCGSAWADRFLLLPDDPPVHPGHGPALQRPGPQGRGRHRPPARRAEGSSPSQCRRHQDHGAGRSGRTPSDGDGPGRDCRPAARSATRSTTSRKASAPPASSRASTICARPKGNWRARWRPWGRSSRRVSIWCCPSARCSAAPSRPRPPACF